MPSSHGPSANASRGSGGFTRCNRYSCRVYISSPAARWIGSSMPSEKVAYVDAMRSRPIAIRMIAAERKYRSRCSIRMTATAERDYVLGTHDDEIERLGLQHRVWRPRALDAWRRAGFTVGQTLLDLGCGPGYASADMAEIVGPSGRIVAIDRSRRFLDVAESRGFPQIETREIDLDEGELPTIDADGAWARWIFAFVKRPRDLTARVRRSLKPGGILVLHEYIDYGAWQVSPRSAAHAEFVQLVMKSWRESGGEPDVGLDLPRWLTESGFEIRSLLLIVDFIRPTDFTWQ